MSITSTNNSTSSSQINSSEDHVVQLEDIEFLDVVDINDLICFISKKIMRDPVQLPCGHTFSYSAVNQKYLATLKKICPIPTCSQPYISCTENCFLKEVVTSCLKIIRKLKQQPNKQLRKQCIELWRAIIPEGFQERETINIALCLLFEGLWESAIDVTAGLMKGTSNEAQYMPILKWMQEHSPVSNNKESLSQQADQPVSEGDSLEYYKRLLWQEFSPVSNNKESLSQQADQPTSEDDSPEYYKRLLKGVKFLDVIKIHRLICPLSKTVAFDLDQLIPCGDFASHRAMRQHLFAIKAKICPTCAKPYTSAMKNVFLRKVVESFSGKIAEQPFQRFKNELIQLSYLRFKNELIQLYATLPEKSQEKQKIKEALDFFLQGSLREASLVIADIILTNSNDSIYQPLFNSMSDYLNTSAYKVGRWIRQVNLSAKSNSAMAREISGPTPPNNNLANILPKGGSIQLLDGTTMTQQRLSLKGIEFNRNDASSYHMGFGGMRGDMNYPQALQVAYNTHGEVQSTPVPNHGSPLYSSTSTYTNPAEQIAVFTRNNGVQTVPATMNNKASSNTYERESLKRSLSGDFYKPVAKHLRSQESTTSPKSIISLEEEEIAGEELNAKESRVESENHHSSQTRTAQEGNDVFMDEISLPSSLEELFSSHLL